MSTPTLVDDQGDWGAKAEKEPGPRMSSAAVMARRSHSRATLDYFPTPAWATRAICEHLDLPPGLSCLEPAAGGGHMVEVLEGYFDQVMASDIADYGQGYEVADFLTLKPPPQKFDWLITNPPFRLAEAFALTAPRHARNWALLCRLSWLETVGRYKNLWSARDFPPVSQVVVFSERVAMVSGRLPSIHDGSATAYAWFVWREDDSSRQICWVPPGSRVPDGQEPLPLVEDKESR